MSVVALGYIGLNTAGDLEDWSAFATDVLGASVRHDGERLIVRLDEHVYRIEVRAASENGVSHIGWDVGTPARLSELSKTLSQAGVTSEPGSPELCKARGVLELLQCRDPAGTKVELFYGRMSPSSVFISPQGVRFITGALGLGHVVFRVNPLEETQRFYQDLLGFRITDIWTPEGFRLVFMHCNQRHHSLALRPLAKPGAELVHFMLEVDGVDAVGLAADRGQQAISRTLGRHFNDGMLSCYFRTPCGHEVEYGTGGKLVDDATWSVGQIDKPSGWGHAMRPAPDKR